MLKEFIDFVDSVLPSVSPDFRDGAKDAISQFEKDGHRINYLTATLLPELSQGDIISQVPFTYFEEDGRQMIFTADAMVISTSCHIDQKDKILMVLVLPIDSFTGNLMELKKNMVFDFMYISDSTMSKRYICFNLMTSYNKKLICGGIENGRIRRIASLNQIGYYFFIIKLSVYLMRKEDSDTLNFRRCFAEAV